MLCEPVAAESDCMVTVYVGSKFDHTNIVKLIGICFDTRPYYIVLELLAGGDLKMFLRQVRPQQVNTCILWMYIFTK